jgi:hypothetical protein
MKRAAKDAPGLSAGLFLCSRLTPPSPRAIVAPAVRHPGDTMPDPIARLEFCRQEVDRVFGAGHAAANPELVSTIMLTAALDFAAIRLSAAIEQVALVLSEPETMPDNTPIVRASSLLHPR